MMQNVQINLENSEEEPQVVNNKYYREIALTFSSKRYNPSEY